MSQYMNLPAAYDIIDKLIPNNNKAEQSYYNILYKISTKVWEERIKKNMNQKQFAEALGVSQAMVSKYESGDYNFTIHQICKLCDKLDLSVDLVIKDNSYSQAETYGNKEDFSNIPIDYKILEEAA